MHYFFYFSFIQHQEVHDFVHCSTKFIIVLVQVSSQELWCCKGWVHHVSEISNVTSYNLQRRSYYMCMVLKYMIMM